MQIKANEWEGLFKDDRYGCVTKEYGVVSSTAGAELLTSG